MFSYLPAIFLFAIWLAQSIKNISKHFFHLIRPSTKIVEFDNENFPKMISTNDGTWREFLETDSNSMFSKKWVPQKREFSYPFYQSINYDNLIVTKHVYVPPDSKNRGSTSLIIFRRRRRLTVLLEGGYRYRVGEGDLFPCPTII